MKTSFRKPNAAVIGLGMHPPFGIRKGKKTSIQPSRLVGISGLAKAFKHPILFSKGLNR